MPDEGKRAEAQAELQRAMLDQKADLNKAMADVMKADASSESAMARNARPIVVYWALAMITWVGVASPMIGLQAETIAALKGVPEDLWSLLSVGIGAYMLARSVDKIVPQVLAK
ncbi:3TM-type holin [Methylorubrum podarium]|uniref:3TM-type holin n=1 Tax=Methylorubrum podarium TaxID=200476 RepID=UPI0024B5D7B6|nr:3TM-type holin [Methylorubrum podarium]